MKTILFALLITTIVAPATLTAQTITSTNDLTRQQEMWIIKNGFNLRKYDWQNEDVNFHLNLALDAKKPAPYLIAGGAGAQLLGIIIMLAASSDLGYETGAAVGFGFGAALSVGGGVSIMIGARKNKDARYQLDKAIDLNQR